MKTEVFIFHSQRWLWAFSILLIFLALFSDVFITVFKNTSTISSSYSVWQDTNKNVAFVKGWQRTMALHAFSRILPTSKFKGLKVVSLTSSYCKARERAYARKWPVMQCSWTRKRKKWHIYILWWIYLFKIEVSIAKLSISTVVFVTKHCIGSKQRSVIFSCY